MIGALWAWHAVIIWLERLLIIASVWASLPAMPSHSYSPLHETFRQHSEGQSVVRPSCPSCQHVALGCCQRHVTHVHVAPDAVHLCLLTPPSPGCHCLVMWRVWPWQRRLSRDLAMCARALAHPAAWLHSGQGSQVVLLSCRVYLVPQAPQIVQ